MPKRLIQISIVTLGLVVVVGAFALVASSLTKSSDNLSSATANTGTVSQKAAASNPTDSIASTSERIVMVGIMTCLTPKDGSGAQAASCALGLYGTDGNYYGLHSNDPTLVGSLPSGQRIQVTGFIDRNGTTGYKILGIIDVTQLRKL